MPEKEVLRLVGSAEKYSEHPLARAILRHCMREGVNLEEPVQFQVIAGGGVRAKVRDSQGIERDILIGSGKLIEKNKINLPEIFSDIATTVYASIDGKVQAVFFTSSIQ